MDDRDDDLVRDIQIRLHSLIGALRVLQWILGSLLGALLTSSVMLSCRIVDEEERGKINAQRLDLVEQKITQFDQFRVESTTHYVVLDSEMKTMEKQTETSRQDTIAHRLSMDARILDDEKLLRDIQMHLGPSKP